MADSEKHFAFHLLFRNPGYQRAVNSRHKKKSAFQTLALLTLWKLKQIPLSANLSKRLPTLSDKMDILATFEPEDFARDKLRILKEPVRFCK